MWIIKWIRFYLIFCTDFCLFIQGTFCFGLDFFLHVSLGFLFCFVWGFCYFFCFQMHLSSSFCKTHLCTLLLFSVSSCFLSKHKSMWYLLALRQCLCPRAVQWVLVRLLSAEECRIRAVGSHQCLGHPIYVSFDFLLRLCDLIALPSGIFCIGLKVLKALCSSSFKFGSVYFNWNINCRFKENGHMLNSSAKSEGS